MPENAPDTVYPRAIPLGSTIPEEGLTLTMDWIPAQHAPSWNSRHHPPAPPGYLMDIELGRGGMGIVYRGQQIGLNRPVAIKMLLSRGSDQDREVIRFLAEAEAVASVRHPHVVEVYQFGTHLELPFLAMEYCPGGTLAQLLRSDSLPSARQLIQILAKAADGVEAAHRRGIVHRDLKPSNIMFTADGEPKVMDFGLAKLASGSDLTRTGTIMGTPAYMSPEQARGDSKFVAPTSDVWALGVILYEMLVGQNPFVREDQWATLQAVTEGRFDSPRRVNSQIPSDVELIILKCLNLDPTQRYPSAGELANDLRRWLNGQPILARPAGSIERAVKWARRNKLVAACLLLTGLSLLAGTGFASWQAWEAHQAAERERDQRALAESRAAVLATQQQELKTNQTALEQQNALNQQLRAESEQAFLANLRQQGQKALAASQPIEAAQSYLAALERTADAAQQQRLRQWIGASLGRLPEVSWSSKFPGVVAGVKFSPDGQLVVVYGSPATAQIYNARTGEPIGPRLSHGGPILAADFDPVSERLATGSADGVVKIWDTKTGQLRHDKIRTPGPVHQVIFHAKGQELLTGGSFTPLNWNSHTGKALFDPAPRRVELFESVPVEVRKTIERLGKIEEIREVDTAFVLRTRHLSPLEPGSPALAHLQLIGPRHVASVIAPGTVEVIHLSAPDPLRFRWTAAKETITDLDADKGHQRFAISSSDGRVSLFGRSRWQPNQWQKLFASDSFQSGLELPTHQDGATCVAFSPNGLFLASGGANRNAILSRLVDPRQAEKFPVPIPVNLPAADPLTWPIAFRNDPKDDPPTPKSPVPQPPTTPPPGPSPGGTNMALGLNSTPIERTHRILPHANTVHRVVFSPDSRYLLTCSEDQTARLWLVETGEPLSPPLPHPSGVRFGAWSPDSRGFLTACEDGTIKAWSLVQFPLAEKILFHPDEVNAIRLSPDGSQILTVSDDGEARLWKRTTGELFPIKFNSGGVIRQAHWLPDGRGFITIGDIADALVWDAASGKVRYSLLHDERLTTAQLTADGQRLATITRTGTLRLWNLTTGQELFTARDPVLGPPVKPISPPPKAPPVIPSPKAAAIPQEKVGLKAIPPLLEPAALFSLLTLQPPQPLAPPQPLGRSILARMALAPNGQWIAVASESHLVRLFDGTTGALLKSITAPVGLVAHLSFSPDSQLLLVGGRLGAQIWDLRTDKALSPILTHRVGSPSAILFTEFSKSGEFFATGAVDGTSRVWRTADTAPVGPVLQNERAVHRLSFSPAGDRLLTISTDSVRHWHVATGELLQLPLKHGDEILWAEFDHQGEAVFTSSRDRTARVWPAPQLDRRSPAELKAWLARFNSTTPDVSASAPSIVEPLKVKLGPEKPREAPPRPTPSTMPWNQVEPILTPPRLLPQPSVQKELIQHLMSWLRTASPKPWMPTVPKKPS